MDQCHTLCYLEPNCVSANYNTKHGVIPNCELSSSDDEKHPQNLIDKPGVIYQAIIVSLVSAQNLEKNGYCFSKYY
jgi:hypothetical protein